MDKVFILINFKDELAILREEKGPFEIFWPKTYLPENSKIGDKINFSISLNDLELKKRKQLAQDVLNEILSINEN